MRHWLQLATRNLRARPGRTFTAAAATALGVGTVIWVTSSFESVKRSISEQIIDRWVGRSHLSVESPLGHWGDIDAETIDLVRNTEGVIRTTPRLKRRLVLNVKPDAPGGDDDALLSSRDVIYVDAVGIDPSSEYAFRTYDVDGRTPNTGDRGVAVIEANTAREFGLAIGDRIRLELYANGPGETLRIIGLSEVRRVAKFQRPLILLTLSDLQRISEYLGKLTVVDAMIADPSADALERAAVSLRRAFRERGFSYQVTTATARLNQLAEAQQQTEFALLLVSSVALLTAFFIIMTTMSMGMVERIGQLGTLRCLGMTRRQLAALVLMEVTPVGIAGLILGVPIGLGLTYLGTLVAEDYLQEVVISPKGLVFALIGGAVTTFAAAILPALGASRVSPLAASRPQSKPTRNLAHVLAALLGAFMVALHIWMVQHLPIAQWFRPPVAIAGVALLYLGCGLITPLAVRVAGGLFVQVAARLLWIKPALLNDQVDRAAWRGAGICCGLMVGLSLLIGVVVHSASVRAGWDFPKRLAEAFVWTRAPVPRSYGDVVSRIPGVSECTIINDFLCEVGRTKSGFFDRFRVRSTFVAGEPDVFLTMTKLEFLEGDLEDARSKLLSGGYLLLPPEASRAFGLHLGDRVEVTVADRRAEFEVAGVIQSPALDIAVTYFQADSYMMVAAAGSVLGTLDDARKHFGVDGASLFLMNFTLPDTPHPPMFES
ncbi:MAG: ABC transporter permease, partial [Planctomycetes bacterium]|nr:ABC transporter permease [Planctomycetota bacterium]